MSRHYVIFYTDDSNVKEWEDITPDKIHRIKFKGKWYDEMRYGRWEKVNDDDSLYRCSACGELSCCKSSYCGECGAKMDEVLT